MNGNYIKVADVTIYQVVTVDPIASVREAIDIMCENKLSSLIVDRKGPDDEYGFLSISDIASKITSENKAPERVQVYEVMTKPIVTVPSDMNVKYGVRMLVKFDLSHAVVVNEKREPIGIVTMRDMVLQHYKQD